SRKTGDGRTTVGKATGGEDTEGVSVTSEEGTGVRESAAVITSSRESVERKDREGKEGRTSGGIAAGTVSGEPAEVGVEESGSPRVTIRVRSYPRPSEQIAGTIEPGTRTVPVRKDVVAEERASGKTPASDESGPTSGRGEKGGVRTDGPFVGEGSVNRAGGAAISGMVRTFVGHTTSGEEIPPATQTPPKPPFSRSVSPKSVTRASVVPGSAPRDTIPSSPSPPSSSSSSVPATMASPPEPVHVRKFRRLQAGLSRSRDLATGTEGVTADQLFLRTSGVFWLEASWTIRRSTVERARAALAHLWHESRPVLRLSEIIGDGTNTAVRRMVSTVEIQGGVNRWYLNVDDPPRTFQVEIGYMDPEGRFIGLVKSNLITTSPDADSPVPGQSPSQRAAEEEDLNTTGVGSFEDRLRRSLAPGLRQPFAWTPGRFLYGESEGADYQGFHFEVDAALVVYGATDPGVRLSVRGNPVRIQTDGTFMMRFSLPNRRQVIPIVARSVDGLEQRTVIIAVERNTKVMEPIICEPGDGNE
ncbi:MAG: DUF4912 domain-containing protein, partial [Planctomycetia bacterium]|nr:DUF4912 domain-containing protein [Planctomycetia bacterium]